MSDDEELGCASALWLIVGIFGVVLILFAAFVRVLTWFGAL